MYFGSILANNDRVITMVDFPSVNRYRAVISYHISAAMFDYCLLLVETVQYIYIHFQVNMIEMLIYLCLVHIVSADDLAPIADKSSAGMILIKPVTIFFRVGDMYTCPRARETGQMPIISGLASRGS